MLRHNLNKSAAFLIVSLLMILVSLNHIYAAEFFSALSGRENAITVVMSGSMNDGKLVQIFTFRHIDTTYEPKNMIDINMATGTATGWFYTFYSESDDAFSTFFVTKVSDTLVVTPVKISTIDPDNLFHLPFLKKELKSSLIDSKELPDLKVIAQNGHDSVKIGSSYGTTLVLILSARDTTKEIDFLPDSVEYYWVISDINTSKDYFYDEAIYIDAEESYTYVKDRYANTIDNKSGLFNYGITSKVIPNPANEFFYYFKSDDSISSISIYNSFGEKLLIKEINGEKTKLDIHSLSPGIYYIIEDNNLHNAYPLVIER